MFIRSYVVSGIKPIIAKEWKKEFKNDVKFFREQKTGNYSMITSLSLFQAINAKIELIGYNIRHRNKLKIKRYKGRRYRV